MLCYKDIIFFVLYIIIKPWPPQIENYEYFDIFMYFLFPKYIEHVTLVDFVHDLYLDNVVENFF